MNNISDSYKLNLWIPELFSLKGGIQVYSAYFLKALQSLYPHLQYNVFLKNDYGYIANVFDTHCTSFNFSGKLIKPFRTAGFCAKIIGSAFFNQPNLIISTHLNFTPASYLLKRILGIPYWIVVHGIEVWNLQNPLLQLALQGADLILAVSHYTRDRLLLEQSLDPQKVVVLFNTFDSDRFQIAPKPPSLLDKYNLNADHRIILTVARLDPSEQNKGYDKILAVLPQIRQVIPNIHYLLVGKGNDQSRIQQLIQRYEIQDCVTLTGFVSDDELCNYYNLCDIFAMPSKKEGFGIVYLEAMACGKPTLGGNQDGALDALDQGGLGALVNPDIEEDIAHTLIQMLEGTYPNSLMYQPELLRQKVIEIYGFDKFVQTLAEYLNKSGLLGLSER